LGGRTEECAEHVFFLLTLHAYHRYVRKSSAGRYALVALLFALGLMAKPEIITLPFVLLLWDYWPLQRMGRRSPDGQGAVDVEPRSFFSHPRKSAAAFAFGWQRGDHANRSTGRSSDPARVELGAVWECACCLRALSGEAFWPTRLVPLYPHPGQLLPTWEIIASATLLLSLTVLVVLQSRCHRYLAVG
jgi:protein O-mannosyl-transferase